MMSLTLRMRIFLAITALIVISSAFMASITIFHFREENKNYHQENRESLEFFHQETKDKSMPNISRKSELIECHKQNPEVKT